MKTIIIWLLVWLINPTPIHAATPDIIVQYHIWWDTSYGTDSAVWPIATRSNNRDQPLWGLWDLRSYEPYNTDKPTPDTLQPDGWRRFSTTSETSYPLIGLYDPDNPEIMRWHIRLAKAAGIKAFAISIYDWKTVNPPFLKRQLEVMRKFLQVAKEEDFYLSWEVWNGGPNIVSILADSSDIINHPNFYRVDGRPLIWISPTISPNDFFGSDTQGFVYILNQIETAVGTPLSWAINNLHTNLDLASISQYRDGIIPMTDANIVNTTNWSQYIAAFHNLPKSVKMGAHIYPGFDDTVLKRGADRRRPRNGGETLIKSLELAAISQADYIFIESWNDFAEATSIEPGYKADFYNEPYKRDYYKDLRIIATFNNKDFVQPDGISPAVVDPAVVTKYSKPTYFRGIVSNLTDQDLYFRLVRQYGDQWVEVWGQSIKALSKDVPLEVDISDVYGHEGSIKLESTDNKLTIQEAKIEFGNHLVINFLGTNENASLAGDLTGEGHVDLADYNLLVAHYGDPYTLADYNNLITSYGQ